MITILFSEIKNKKVKIKVKNFSTAGEISYKGQVVDCFSTLGNNSEIFIKLDTGEIINGRYIESITIIG